MAEQKYIHDLHGDHKVWLSELSLVKDQLKSFQNRLEKVAIANTNKDILAKVEHFQNQFIRENEVIDILKHDINQKEALLVANVASNSVAADHRKTDDEPELRDRMLTFSKIFNELSAEYHEFLAEVL